MLSKAAESKAEGPELPELQEAKAAKNKTDSKGLNFMC